MINSRYCFNCNKVYTTDERNHGMNCPTCTKLLDGYVAPMQKKAREHYNTTRPFLRVVQDPGEYPLSVGLSLSREEYKYMIALGNFTPGTTLVDQRGRMVTV